MKFVGVGGGIGSGKSTVSAALACDGAPMSSTWIRSLGDVQRAGTPVFEDIVARWGDAVVGPDGELDRVPRSAASCSPTPRSSPS